MLYPLCLLLGLNPLAKFYLYALSSLLFFTNQTSIYSIRYMFFTKNM